MPTLRLNLDYDCSRAFLCRTWARGMGRIFRVFASKRTYMPLIYVSHVDATRKGFHVYADCSLSEYIMDEKDGKWITLGFQDILGSDATRSMFDKLRLVRDEQVFNLLFSFKNGYLVQSDPALRDRLNDITKKVLGIC